MIEGNQGRFSFKLILKLKERIQIGHVEIEVSHLMECQQKNEQTVDGPILVVPQNEFSNSLWYESDMYSEETIL